jgi:hypothetical protein
MLKKLIEKLLTDVVSDVTGENLKEEASENETSNFLQLYDKIDGVKFKNEIHINFISILTYGN